MTKFLPILTFLIVWIPSITTEKLKFCKFEAFFTVCGYNDVITSVDAKMDNHSLELYLNDFSEIAPYTFRNLRLSSLQFVWMRLTDWGSILNWESCSPKAIKLTPNSFVSLSVDNLQLECMRIATVPNPFKKLTTITSLQLIKVQLTGRIREFLADFPHLKKLKLIDLNITNISQDIFSRINKQLIKLEISDRISVIESKSFERFSKLKNLELTRGHLTELRADTFDGLDQLRYLNLALNDITVLRNHTFSKLAQLQTLILDHNTIRQIQLDTFSGLNIHRLNLDNITLRTLPVGLFDNLRNLKVLYLRLNEIEVVPPHVFDGLVKLQKLNLNFNEISYIDSNAFRGLHLRNLNLAYNNLTTLEDNTFSGLHVDSALNLYFNSIHKIQQQTFRNLTAGQVLICRNHLDKVERDIWSVQASIQRIIIKYCSYDY